MLKERPVERQRGRCGLFSSAWPTASGMADQERCFVHHHHHENISSCFPTDAMHYFPLQLSICYPHRHVFLSPAFPGWSDCSSHMIGRSPPFQAPALSTISLNDCTSLETLSDQEINPAALFQMANSRTEYGLGTRDTVFTDRQSHAKQELLEEVREQKPHEARKKSHHHPYRQELQHCCSISEGRRSHSSSRL